MSDLVLSLDSLPVSQLELFPAAVSLLSLDDFVPGDDIVKDQVDFHDLLLSFLNNCSTVHLHHFDCILLHFPSKLEQFLSRKCLKEVLVRLYEGRKFLFVLKIVFIYEVVVLAVELTTVYALLFLFLDLRNHDRHQILLELTTPLYKIGKQEIELFFEGGAIESFYFDCKISEPYLVFLEELFLFSLGGDLAAEE